MTTHQAFYFTGYSKPGPEAEKKGLHLVGPRPKPAIANPDDILIRVHAASVNPIDFKLAQGDLKLVLQQKFPSTLGYDVSGVVEAIGSAVTKFAVGDAVLARVHASQKGSFAEYVISSEDITCKKPTTLSHREASCLPLAGQTALQSIRRMGENRPEGIQSIFIPAAMGGVGLLAIQLARHHFKIPKIVTTVSTAKVAQTKELLDGPDLEIIDYRKADPVKGREGTFDAVFDCVGEADSYMPLLKVNEPPAAPSQIVSIATAPDSVQAAGFGGDPSWIVKKILDYKDWRLRCGASKRKAVYSYLLLHETAADLQILCDLAEQGKVKPLVGKVFPLAQTTLALKASADGSVTGKVVIEVIPEDGPAPAASSSSSSSSSSAAPTPAAAAANDEVKEEQKSSASDSSAAPVVEKAKIEPAVEPAATEPVDQTPAEKVEAAAAPAEKEKPDESQAPPATTAE